MCGQLPWMVFILKRVQDLICDQSPWTVNVTAQRFTGNQSEKMVKDHGLGVLLKWLTIVFSCFLLVSGTINLRMGISFGAIATPRTSHVKYYIRNHNKTILSPEAIIIPKLWLETQWYNEQKCSNKYHARWSSPDELFEVELDHHWFRWWHVTCSRPSHYQNWSWHVVHRTFRDNVDAMMAKERTVFALLCLVVVWNHYIDSIMGAMASRITSFTIVYSTVYLGADQRKHQSSASLTFVRVIHRGPVNSPHKGPVTQKMVPFDDVIIMPDVSIYSWVKLLPLEQSSNWPYSQISECTCTISHDAPFRTELCTFLFWVEHCRIWTRTQCRWRNPKGYRWQNTWTKKIF